MKKFLVAVTILVLVAVPAAGCAEIPLPTGASSPAPTEEKANFRLLISDDVNAIDQFASLNVTISRVGVHMGGESGKWFEPPLATVELDLVPLQEENAQEIWTGILDDGDYNKVFVHVTEIRGVLKTGETIDNIELPSDKLHINTHFSIPEDAPVNFVFDLTVVAAGNEKSGIKYILKPVVSESGPKQKFNDVTPKGKPDEQEFKGVIKSIDEATSTWTMEIEVEGELELWTVDVSEADIKGDAAVDLEAEVKGTVVGDKTIKASEVEIKEAEEEEFEGVIKTIDEATSTWTMEIEVEGELELWTVDVSEAEIDGDPAVDLEAEVTGTVVEDKTIKASKVKIK